MIDKDQAQAALGALEADHRDLYFYSGVISEEHVHRFIPILASARRRRGRTRASLVLTTYGGDPHYAYRLARLFQDLYGDSEGFRLVVLGPCKSAGALVAVGAGELAIDDRFGELGPLDIQLAKRDDIAARTSGLDTLGALSMLQSEAFNAFQAYMVTMVLRFGHTVSTKTACDIAATIVSGLFQPIASQIDPHRLSEVDRRMEIAEAYGDRLGTPNLKNKGPGGSLRHLTRDYPAHGFVIDRKEASGIFRTVRTPSVAETVVLPLFGDLVAHPPSLTEKAEIYDVVDELDSIANDTTPTAGQPDRPGRKRPSGADGGEKTGREASSPETSATNPKAVAGPGAARSKGPSLA